MHRSTENKSYARRTMIRERERQLQRGLARMNGASRCVCVLRSCPLASGTFVCAGSQGEAVHQGTVRGWSSVESLKSSKTSYTLYKQCCCECGCYDAFCDGCCPCVTPGTRDAILCCAVSLAVVAAAVLLAAYGFIRHAAVTVEDASLTRLQLLTSPATAFAYNLSLTLHVRNTNWAMAVKNTQPLEAAYVFNGQRFDRVRLADEGDTQPAANTRVYHLASSGDATYVSLGSAGVAEFRKENATGVFLVDLELSGEVRYQAHYTKCKFAATCALKLQLAPPGTPAVVFEKVKCKLAPPDKNC